MDTHRLTVKIISIAFLVGILAPHSVSAYTFTQLLQKGSSSNEVKELQLALKTDNTVYPEGLATGYFGALTEKAVQRFQSKYGIINYGTPASTGYGLVGKRTRAKLNEVFPVSAANPPASITPPTPIPPPPVTVVPPSILPPPTTIPPATPQTLPSLVSYNGGEIWQAGSSQTIRWGGGVKDWKIVISFLNPAKSISYPLIINTENDGYETITIPADLSGSYYVRIACYLSPCSAFTNFDDSESLVTVQTVSTVAPSPVPPPPPSPVSAYQPDPGLQNTAVLLFNFPDKQDEPFDVNFADSVVFGSPTSLKAYYKEVSYDKLLFNGHTYSWHTMPYPRSSYCTQVAGEIASNCNFTKKWVTTASAASNALLEDAIEASRPYVNYSNIKHVILVFRGAHLAVGYNGIWTSPTGDIS
ncbi:MAG: peptidoglycan-binding protein, partial [Patescibacteria group bacterium]